jgi:hypothetical protein
MSSRRRLQSGDINQQEQSHNHGRQSVPLSPGPVLATPANRPPDAQTPPLNIPDDVPFRPYWDRVLHFHEQIHSVRDFSFPEPCTVCHESFPGMKFQVRKHKCLRCSRNPKFETNGGLNPKQSVPEELLDLTMVEEALISIINPMFRVVALPYNGYKYSGHVISFPKPVDEMCYILPRLPADVACILARKTDQRGHCRQFQVRRHRVANALLWLQRNHPDYRSILISNERLQSLPQHGDIAVIGEVIHSQQQSHHNHDDVNDDALAADRHVRGGEHALREV